MDINVAMAADANYFRFLETAALSAMLNKAESSRLCFHILCDRISDMLKGEFSGLCERHGACVQYYDSDISSFSALPGGGYTFRMLRIFG